MMQRIGLLLLVILIESCVAQIACGTKEKCSNKGGHCQLNTTDCDGKVWSGKKFCEKWDVCNCCFNCSEGIKPPCQILNGICMKKDEVCNGTEVINNKFCRYRDTCKCCIPLIPDYDCCSVLSPPGFWIPTGTINSTNCSEHESIPTGIFLLGGQCCWQICGPFNCTYNNQDGHCRRFQLNGTISVGPQECKDGCQCYIEDNNCENERKCDRPDAESEGYYPTGHCRKECHADEVRKDRCDINPEGSCNCCLRKKEDCPKPNCEAVYENQLYDGICRVDDCLSMEIRADYCPDSNCKCCINATEVCDPERCTYKDRYRGRCLRAQPNNAMDVGNQDCNDGCNCYIPNTDCGPACTSASVQPNTCECVEGPCPEGTCFFDVDLCFGCSCCKIANCKSKHNQCTDPGDFCVDQFENRVRICPKGFAKVYNTCFKNSTKTVSPNLPTSINCDCCKNLACAPNSDDRCSGKGAFCTDSLAVCPPGYITSNDCSKPVVVNGVWVASKLCKCCTPFPIEKFRNTIENARQEN